MKNDLNKKIAGAVLLLIGLLFFTRQMGWVILFQKFTMMAVFGILGVVFLIVYFCKGVRNWGWLFPACLFCTAGLVTFIASIGIHRIILVAPLIASLGVPFLVGFLLDPKRYWWTIAPASVLAAFAAGVICLILIHVFWLPLFLLISLVISFSAYFLMNRSRWWALLGAYFSGLFLVFPYIVSLSGYQWFTWTTLVITIITTFALIIVFHRTKLALLVGGILVSIAVSKIMIKIGYASSAIFPVLTIIFGAGALLLKTSRKLQKVG